MTTSKPAASCPWEDARDRAIAGFETDLRSDSLDAALTMLRRRLGFLCLSRDEIETEIAMVMEAAGLDPATFSPCAGRRSAAMQVA